MTPYVVRTGDHLQLIAHRAGVDPDVVWNDPQNADLKALRGSPNILCPGDIVYLPDPPPKKWLAVAVGGENRYTAALPTVTVTVTFSRNDTPLAGQRCIAHGLPASTKPLVTDGSGKLTLKVPIVMQLVELELPDVPLTRQIRVGHLDPVTATTGVVQRLRNLRYISPYVTVRGDDPTALRAIVASFQRSRGLPATGDVDDATQSALVQAHGC